MKLRLLLSFYYAFTVAEKERKVKSLGLISKGCIPVPSLSQGHPLLHTLLTSLGTHGKGTEMMLIATKDKNTFALLTLVIAVKTQIGFNKNILPLLASQQLASNDIKIRSVENKASSWHKHCPVSFLHCRTCSSLNFAERLKLIYSSLRGEIVPHFENNGT